MRVFFGCGQVVQIHAVLGIEFLARVDQLKTRVTVPIMSA